jgi:phosphonate transport system substrate-binding protein
VLFAPTPKVILERVAQGQAVAGALSRDELAAYSPAFDGGGFRVLYADDHIVPPGALLLAPTVEGKLQNQIRRALSETPSILAQEVGFIPNGRVPDYQYMITVVKRVRAIAGRGALLRLFLH